MRYPFKGEVGPLMQFASLQMSRLTQLKNFFFLNDFVNPVTWTLKVEMIGSMMLPILHFLTRKWGWPGRIMLLLVLISWAFVPSSGHARRRLYMFYLGYLVIDLEHFPKLPRRNLSAITGPCLIAFLGAVLLGESFFGFRFGLLIEATSAAAIILCIQARGGSLWGVLDHAWSHFAGRVSYSVFLAHLVILDIVINLMKLSPLGAMIEHGLGYYFYWLGLLISIPIVILTAAVLYRWVEKPFINLSKTSLFSGSSRKTAIA
jgi:peptidoglycan/LPS O-acetylase OafA/YrhL